MAKITERSVNGMPIFINSTPDDTLVGIGVRVAVGSMHELENEAGTAHYLEHLIFKGSKSMQPHEFIQLADELALHDNAYTCQDHTFYYFVSLPEVLDTAFAGFIDCIRRPALRPEEIEKERNVILEEIKLRDTNSNLVSYEKMQTLLYPEHPYSRAIPGSLEQLTELPVETLQNFHDKHYRSENISFFFSGAITADAAVALVEQMEDFASGTESAVPAELKPLVAADFHEERELEQVCSVHCATRIPLHGDLVEMAPYRLLRTVLSGGMSAPLFFRIRVQEGLVYSISSSVDSTPLGTEFEFSWSSRHSNIERVRELALEELRKIADGAITDEQLEIAQRKLVVNILNANQTVSGRLNNMLAQQNSYGRCYEDAEIIAGYRSITKETIMAAARQLGEQEWVLSTVGNSTV